MPTGAIGGEDSCRGRLLGLGADTNGAPRPAEGIGARPPSIVLCRSMSGPIAGGGIGTGAGSTAGIAACERGGILLSAVLRFPNTQQPPAALRLPLQELLENRRQQAWPRFLVS